MITGEPEQTLPARTVVVDLMRVGREWVATAPELGEAVWRDDLEAVKEAAREKLGPHVTPEFREVGPPGA